MRLWELAGANPARVFSPYVWKVRLVLAHKAIKYESVSWRYADKTLISPSQKVPVLDVEDKRLFESRHICQYLEEKYPEHPVFVHDNQAGAASLDFFESWATTVLSPALKPIIILDAFNSLAHQDKEYFRSSREAAAGKPLEQICPDHAAAIQSLRGVLEPVRQTLSKHRWLGGDSPNYADFTLAGMFLWARAVSRHKLLESLDPVYEWRQRLFSKYQAALQGTAGYEL